MDTTEMLIFVGLFVAGWSFTSILLFIPVKKIFYPLLERFLAGKVHIRTQQEWER